MSVRAKILNLLSGITDPTIRVDVASTIYYLMDIYASGSAKEGEIKQSLFEICFDVIRATRPDLIEEEARQEAQKMADELMSAFRMETLRRRVSVGFRARGLPRI
mgnify:FL=1